VVEVPLGLARHGLEQGLEELVTTVGFHHVFFAASFESLVKSDGHDEQYVDTNAPGVLHMPVCQQPCHSHNPSYGIVHHIPSHDQYKTHHHEHWPDLQHNHHKHNTMIRKC
jgi:hypothetical protein